MSEMHADLKAAQQRILALKHNLLELEEAGKRTAERLIQVERRLSDANGEVLRLGLQLKHHLQLQAERDALAAKLAELEGQEPVQIDEPDYHWEAMGCGLEDRNITSRYEAMKHGWDCAIDRMLEQISEPLYARPVPAEKSVPDGFCIAPSTRGYARMGAGRYVLQPCLADVDGVEVPSLVIRLATEDECNRRTVGDLEDTPEEDVGVPMDENLIVCQLDFVSDMGLHALQQQLRLLRLEHFPGTSDKERKPLNPLQAPAEQPVNARLLGALSALLDDIEALIGESSGVYGLHLNGDVSPWSELEEGGRFERLSSMSSAREAIAAAESAPKAVRLTDEEIDSYWTDNVDGWHREFAHAIETAVLRANGIEVAE